MTAAGGGSARSASATARVDAYGFAIGDLNRDSWPDIALARSGAINVLYFSEK